MNWFKALSWFGNFYPVRLYIQRRAIDYFFSYHISVILSNARGTYPVSENVDIIQLVRNPAFRGMMGGLFRANEFYPSPKDIAVSINIALDLHCNGYNKVELIDLSFHLSRVLRDRLTADPLLKSILKDLGKEVNEIPLTYDKENIEQCLNSKKELFTNYFKTYSDLNFSYAIRIWHNSEDTDWVEWDKADSIVINIDPLGIREGFFLVGFDYSIESTGERLMFATRKKGLEYFNDLNSSKNIIWAR